MTAPRRCIRPQRPRHRLAAVTVRRRKHWGWGYEDQQATPAQIRASLPTLEDQLGVVLSDVEEPVAIEELELAPPRIGAPPALAQISSEEVHDRAGHALGKSYSDVVRGFRGQFEHPPDLVVRPRDESDVERLLEWCSAERIAVIPYGGGTSVVGGVTPQPAGVRRGFPRGRAAGRSAPAERSTSARARPRPSSASCRRSGRWRPNGSVVRRC